MIVRLHAPSEKVPSWANKMQHLTVCNLSFRSEAVWDFGSSPQHNCRSKTLSWDKWGCIKINSRHTLAIKPFIHVFSREYHLPANLESLALTNQTLFIPTAATKHLHIFKNLLAWSVHQLQWRDGCVKYVQSSFTGDLMYSTFICFYNWTPLKIGRHEIQFKMINASVILVF